MESDVAYFSRRAREEREAATIAANDTARAIHLQMAERYDEMSSARQADSRAAARGSVSA